MNQIRHSFRSLPLRASRPKRTFFGRLLSVFSLPALLISLLSGFHASAEQMQKLGAYDVHYVVVPTSFFNPTIAERYDIVRGKDRALMNLSILDADQVPVDALLKGTMTNLLGQQQNLTFTEVREGAAVYYLAPIKHTDRETLRFSVEITVPGEGAYELKFQQQMYWDGR